MNQHHAKVLERALQAEQWLANIGLHGLVAGIGDPDMQTFTNACGRLVSMLRDVHDKGAAEGAEKERRRQRAGDLPRLLLAAGAGALAGVAAVAVVMALA